VTGGGIYDGAGTTTTIVHSTVSGPGAILGGSGTVAGGPVVGGDIYQAGSALTVTRTSLDYSVSGGHIQLGTVGFVVAGPAAGGALYVAGDNVSLVDTFIGAEGV
jgi:hypothetical protein